MRNFQSFTRAMVMVMVMVMMMMIGTACAAPTRTATPAPRTPVHPKDMLVKIKKHATDLKADLDKSNHTIYVHFPKLNGTTTCVTEFFCLAEKSLNKSLNESRNELKSRAVHEEEILIRQLSNYNKVHTVICQDLDNIKHEILLKKLLENIILCSNRKQHRMD